MNGKSKAFAHVFGLLLGAFSQYWDMANLKRRKEVLANREVIDELLALAKKNETPTMKDCKVCLDRISPSHPQKKLNISRSNLGATSLSSVVLEVLNWCRSTELEQEDKLDLLRLLSEKVAGLSNTMEQMGKKTAVPTGTSLHPRLKEIADAILAKVFSFAFSYCFSPSSLVTAGLPLFVMSSTLSLFLCLVMYLKTSSNPMTINCSLSQIAPYCVLCRTATRTTWMRWLLCLSPRMRWNIHADSFLLQGADF